jgi:uncharacterized membrane protein
MLGLTALGAFHTLVSLVAVPAGVVSLARYKRISPETLTGKVYIATTVVVCLTGFGIYQHGGFNQAHVLGIITLLTLGLAAASGKYRLFGGTSPYVELVGYSLTFFFHLIPAVSEPATRLPLGSPLVASLDAPVLKEIIGVLFVVWLVGVAAQVSWLRGRLRRET